MSEEQKPTMVEVPEIFMLACSYAKKIRNGKALTEEPGTWVSQIDLEWSLEFNPHRTPMFSHKLNRDIPPLTVCFFFNGLQAAVANPKEAKGADNGDDIGERGVIEMLKQAIAKDNVSN